MDLLSLLKIISYSAEYSKKHKAIDDYKIFLFKRSDQNLIYRRKYRKLSFRWVRAILL